MFSNNKIIRAQQKRLAATNAQRENLLLQQHKDQEHLLLSMFPKDVARDLIERYRAEYNHGSRRAVIQAMNPVGNLCQTVVRMHHDVTILFTDIVGFTAMSQEAAPWEVRLCDFAEFSFADAIPLSLSTLQKIGDALSAQALRLL